MVSRLRQAVFAVVCVLVVPAAVYAQGTIAGAVKDASGAVLPGVTVEAASPALIEKVRSVTTNGSGQYRIVDLRPGTYSVTFSLPGFSNVKRDGVELQGSFVASVDAEMKVGGQEETITVTASAPIIDVQNPTKQRVMDHDVLDSIPSGRTATTIGVLIPGAIAQTTGGVVTEDIGGNSGNFVLGLSIHGGNQLDQVYMQGGNLTTANSSTGYVSRTQVNFAATQEIVMDTAANDAQVASGGVRINLLPKEGGNKFSGTLFASYGNDKLQANNLTQALIDAGLATPDSVKRNYDFNPGFGGPILKNRAWFYAASRENASANYAAGSFENANANNPALWTYVASPNKGFNDTTSKGYETRLTWQASQRNKFGFTISRQYNCQCPQGVSVTTAPEAITRGYQTPQTKFVLDYTLPLTNRVLFEAGIVRSRGVSDGLPVDGLNPAMISVLEQTSPANLRYRAASGYNVGFNLSYNARAAVSYVTGSHSYKAGVNFQFGPDKTNHEPGTQGTSAFVQQPVNYRFSNGKPNQITEFARNSNDTFDFATGAFVQDVWTMNRLTVRYGVRYDQFTAGYPVNTLGPTPLTPNRNVTFPEKHNVVNLKDITPRFGLAYDLFGDRKTAVKVSLNKYVANMSAGSSEVLNSSAVSSVTTTATRTWTDNGNFVPDCDLLNQAQQDNRASGGDFCAALNDANFGNTKVSSTFDPSYLHGWGNRNYNWEFSAGVQRQVFTRMALEVSYYRRWFGNFTVTDNRAISASDFNYFNLTAPVDPKLPQGGGYTVADAYDLNPTAFGRPADNFVTLASHYGKQYQHWNGVDLLASLRPGGGLVLQGGTSTGRVMFDNCEVAAKVPELSQPVFTVSSSARQPLSFCHVQSPWQTNGKILASYTVPKIDVQVSGSLQSLPGPVVQANYVATNAILGSSSTLGRLLSGNATSLTLAIVKPGAEWGPRLNQLDMRVAKIIRLGGSKRTTLSVDFFNAPNLNTLQTYNTSYSAYKQPTSILLARFLKLNAQFDF